jgi:Fe2+ transport system protein FeoA
MSFDLASRTGGIKRERINMTLKDLKIGKSCLVLAVGGEKILRKRLLEMGITPRTTVTVKKAAPMGDPIELLLRGYVLSLRLAEAEKIMVEEILS